MALLSMHEHIVLIPYFYGLHCTLGLLLDVWMKGSLADSYIDLWLLSACLNQYTINSANLANCLASLNVDACLVYSHDCIVYSFCGLDNSQQLYLSIIPNTKLTVLLS